MSTVKTYNRLSTTRVVVEEGGLWPLVKFDSMKRYSHFLADVVEETVRLNEATGEWDYVVIVRGPVWTSQGKPHQKLRGSRVYRPHAGSRRPARVADAVPYGLRARLLGKDALVDQIRAKFHEAMDNHYERV